MAVIVEFIKNYAHWLYGACALIALWHLRRAILARHDRRTAVFSLEREAALNRTYASWSVAFALLFVMGVVYFLSTVVAQAVQPLVIGDSTPTPAALTRSVPSPTLPLPETTPTASQPTSAPAATSAPRPTPRVLPTATQAPVPTAPAPAVAAPRCADPNARITSPGMNASVSGMVPIFGTASHDRFKYYKLEFGAGANPAVWSYFDGGEHAVQGGQLGTLNAGALAPGTYSIRVVVVDVTGNFPPPCQTVINVK
ncbi:MAG TPA: hypothetical protein VGA61_09730 [Anaerolineae bacterium]